MIRDRKPLALLITFAGVAVACVGLAMFSPALALVAAGVVIAAFGLLAVEVTP